jgi:hypothetical protein
MWKPFLPDQLREVVSLVLERHKPVVPQADVSSVPGAALHRLGKIRCDS